MISTVKSPIYLLTDLHDTAQLSDAAAAAIYRRRWGGEVYYRTVKRTFPFAKLASRSPHHALIEQRAMLISLWLLQLTSVAARAQTRQPVRRWSGARARRLIRRWLRAALTGSRRGSHPATLLHELAHAVIDSYQRSGPKHRTHCPRQTILATILTQTLNGIAWALESNNHALRGVSAVSARHSESRPPAGQGCPTCLA